MRFVVDEQLSPAVAQWLTDRGQEARHVGDLNLLRQPDRRIAEIAVERDAVMVTKDSDYLAWRVSLPQLRVLWLRVGNGPNRELFTALDRGWAEALVRLTERRAIVMLFRDGRVEDRGHDPLKAPHIWSTTPPARPGA